MHHFDAMNSSASSLFRPWSAGSTIKKTVHKNALLQGVCTEEDCLVYIVYPSLQLLLPLLALPVPALQLRGGLLRDKLDEVGQLPPSLVAHRLLCVLGQPEQGGESSHVVA